MTNVFIVERRLGLLPPNKYTFVPIVALAIPLAFFGKVVLNVVIVLFVVSNTFIVER